MKLKLREFTEPICLFGEGAPERRERLREIMAQQIDLAEPYEAARGAEVAVHKRPAMELAPRVDEPEETRAELFYTEGSEELRTARMWIGTDSLARADRRLAAERHDERLSLKTRAVVQRRRFRVEVDAFD